MKSGNTVNPQRPVIMPPGGTLFFGKKNRVKIEILPEQCSCHRYLTLPARLITGTGMISISAEKQPWKKMKSQSAAERNRQHFLMKHDGLFYLIRTSCFECLVIFSASYFIPCRICYITAYKHRY